MKTHNTYISICIQFCMLAGILLFPGSSSYGQVDYNTYDLLISAGNLPEDITTPLSQKYTLSQNKAKAARKREKDDKSNADFYLGSNFSVDLLLRSGKVIYNDPIANYVKQVFDKTLSTEIGADTIRIYVIKSAAVNAFTTQDGIIFVTVGLLSRLTTEAQLAFILCHEFVHYKEQHSLNQYKEEKKIDKTNEGYTSESTYDESLLRKSAFSQTQETQADEEGLALFLKSAYSLEAVNQSMDILKFSGFPFEEFSYDFTYFEDENFRFPESYFIDTVPKIDASKYELENDDYSTHPNIKTRRTSLNKTITEISNVNKFDFIISEEKFYEIQKMARFEVCHANLLDRDYETAIYHALALMQKDPESFYLQRIVAKAVYALSVYAANGKISKVHLKPQKVEGNLYRLAYLIEQMGREEILLWGLRVTYSIHKKFPEEKEFFIMYQHLVNLGYVKLDITFYQLKNTSKNKHADLNPPKNDSTILYTSTKKKGESDYYMFASFDSYLSDSAFASGWDFHKNKVGMHRLHRAGDSEDNWNYIQTTDAPKKNIAFPGEKNVSLAEVKKDSIPKIILFDPFLIKYDARKNKGIKYKASVKAEEKLSNYFAQNYALLNIDYELISGNYLKKEEVNKLNQISLLHNYFGELIDHGDLYLIATDQPQIDSLCSNLGTSYINTYGIFSLRQSPLAENTLLLTTSIVIPLFVPALLAETISQNSQLYSASGLYDLSQNSLIFSDSMLRQGDNMENINSIMFYLSLRLKKYIKYHEEKYEHNDN